MDEAERNHAVLGNQLLADGIEDDGERGQRIRREVGGRRPPPRCARVRDPGVVLGYQ